VLLVEPGPPQKRHTIERMVRRGARVFAAAGPDQTWFGDLVPPERTVRTDPRDSTRLVEDVLRFQASSGTGWDGVGTFYEHAVVPAADLARALGLPGPSPEAARRSSCDKAAMREACRRAGVPTPRFAAIRDLVELPEAARLVGYPCVFKPAIGSDSFTVVKVEDPSRLAWAVSLARGAGDESERFLFGDFRGGYLVESYLEGPLLAVDGIVQRGTPSFAGVTEMRLGPEPWFNIEVNLLPARQSASALEASVRLVERTLAALGFDDCGFHAELRLTRAGPMLVEIAARLAGGWMLHAYERAYGIDLVAAMVDVWTGREAALVPRSLGVVLQKGVFPARPGRLLRFDVPPDVLEQHPGLWQFLCVTREGYDVVTYPEFPVPIYYYAIEASSEAVADERAAALERSIEVRVGDPARIDGLGVR
jgi:biotin carboxylase